MHSGQDSDLFCYRYCPPVPVAMTMILLQFFSVLALPPISLVLWIAYRLGSNYVVARRVGVPIVIVPINPESPLWMLLTDVLGRYINFVLSWTPYGKIFSRYAHRGWDTRDKAQTFIELGDAFILVTAGKNWLYLCNGDTFADLLQRRNEFKRPLEIMGSPLPLLPMYMWDILIAETAVLNIFGPNLSTVSSFHHCD